MKLTRAQVQIAVVGLIVVAIGFAWFVGLLAWVLVAGSRAVARGATGTFRDLADRTLDDSALDVGAGPASAGGGMSVLSGRRGTST